MKGSLGVLDDAAGKDLVNLLEAIRQLRATSIFLSDEVVEVVAGFWLRPGNSSCANNVVAFTLDLLSYLPSFIRLRVVRADSGCCVPEWLDLLEAKGLRRRGGPPAPTVAAPASPGLDLGAE